jgi:acetylornithine deacetylase
METYHEGNPGHNYENRYNLYATFKGEKERSIMFNGHVDTLPPENESAWSFPPLQPFVRDGRLYGMGVCDMKAGLMAGAMAVKLIGDAGLTLPCTVILSSVCDEEGGGNGSIVAAMGGLRADAVVVCEPTTRELILAHMGFIFFQVEVRGVAVHCGIKLDGVSAIEKARKLMGAIDELEHRWLLSYKHPLLPPPSSNVGVIEGGEAGSTVPDYCCFKTCVHYHPKTMSHDSVVKEYTAAINRCCDGDEWLREHRPVVTVYQSGGPFEMDAAHPLVTSFTETYRALFGKPAKVVGSPAGCDSRTWHGIAGCPTIQYGPGALHQSHAADEYVELRDYLDAILMYAGLILNWGGQNA